MNEPRPGFVAGAAEALAADVAGLAARLAAQLRHDAGSEAEAQAAFGRVLRFLDGQAAGEAQATPAAAPAPTDGPALLAPLAGAGAPAAARRAAPAPLWRLAQTLALRPEDIDLLLLAGLPEAHEGFAAALAALHPRGESRATWGLWAWLSFAGAPRHEAWAAWLRSPLPRLGLVRAPGDAPQPERSLRLAEALWPALGGLPAWPEGCVPAAPPAVGLPADDWLLSGAVQHALAHATAFRPGWITLRGMSAATMAMRAQQLAAALPQAPLFAWDAQRDPDSLAALLAHALLRRVVPVLLLDEPVLPAAHAAALHAHPGPLVLVGAPAAAAARCPQPVLPLEAPPLAASAQCALWRSALPELAEHAATVTTRYSVWPQTLAWLRQDLAAQAVSGQPATLAQAVAGLKTRADRAEDSVARRITPRAGWEDLVLPADKLAALHAAVARMRHQFQVLDDWGFARSVQARRGLRMLFAGLPGTGKTLAAEVVARALHADLMVVDLSRMVSKWLGETEKNLAVAFDQAEATGAVLFFDEADALFGKRTEVSDAHDRYANIESAYLLARLERFDSIAILATNLRQNLDKAFLRRFEVALDFAEPSPDERLALWRRHLPGEAPQAGDVDLPALAARCAMSGAMIRNTALSAAFLGAADGGRITRAHLERALRQEFEKAGRICPL